MYSCGSRTLGDRLAHLLDAGDGGHLGRAVDVDGGTVGQLDLVDHGRRGGDQIQIVFTLQPLLDDLHVQHAEEAAAEAEAQRGGALRFEEQGGIVQGELVEGVAERLVVIAGDGEQARIHLRLHLLEASQRLLGTVLGQGQGITHWRAVDVLDAADNPTYLAATQPHGVHLLGREDTDTIDTPHLTGAHHLDLVVLLQRTVLDPHQRHDAQVGVEPGVDDQRLQRRIRITFRRRDPGHDLFQHQVNTQAGLGGAAHRIDRVDADDVFDLFGNPLRLGGRQVDLVQHRHHFQIHFHGGIAVGQSLCLNPWPASTTSSAPSQAANERETS
jgi:hypothetical protein